MRVKVASPRALDIDFWGGAGSLILADLITPSCQIFPDKIGRYRFHRMKRIRILLKVHPI